MAYSRRGIRRSFHNIKQSLIFSIMEIFSKIPRGPPRGGGADGSGQGIRWSLVMGAGGDFTPLKQSQ